MSDPTEGDGGSAIIEPEKVGAAVDSRRHESVKKRKARMEREDREFFRLMVASDAGRRFMWSILKDCHTFETAFPSGPVGFPDNNAAWFERGRQDTGLRLYQTWHYRAPHEVMAMLVENDSRFQKVDA